MRAILPLALLVVGLAACDSPTAPSKLGDGSVHFLNPQPLPPGLHAATVSGIGCKLYEPPDPCLQ